LIQQRQSINNYPHRDGIGICIQLFKKMGAVMVVVNSGDATLNGGEEQQRSKLEFGLDG